jgi:hypothetical protein
MKKFLIAVLFLAASQVATAQQGEGKIAKLNYRELVKGLISPNKPIRIRNDPPTISIPPTYDWKAQERVEKNRAVLFDHCEEALPFLIEGCADARYSLVSKWSEVHPQTVASVQLRAHPRGRDREGEQRDSGVVAYSQGHVPS